MEELNYYESEFITEETCDYECECEHEDVSEFQFDGVEFLEGVSSVSNLAGKISALSSVGMSNESIIQLLTLEASVQSEREAQAHELKIATINSEMTIKCEEIKAKSVELAELFADN